MSLNHDRGLSLIEAVVAVAILACTVLATTSLVQNGRAALRGAERSGLARVEAENEVERLRSLVFAPSGASERSPGESLVEQVFPHAVPERNTSEAFYRGADGVDQGGCFTCVRHIPAGELTTTARFVVSSRDGFVDVPAARLDGYCFAESGRLPASSLALEVSVKVSGGTEASAYSCATVVVAGP